MSVIRKRVFLLGLLGWLEFGILLACIALSNEGLDLFDEGSSDEGGCVINITPNGRKALIANENLTIICTATGCDNTSSYIQLFRNQSGNINSFLPQSVCLNCLTCNISSKFTMPNVILQCGFIEAKNNSAITYYSNHSEKLEILVQSQLEPISNLVVSQLNPPFLNISWSPVIVYEGLTVSYNISFDGIYFNTTFDTWTKFNATNVSRCDNINLSITPFIAASDQMLPGNTSQWNITYYNNTLINRHTMIMYENGTVSITIVIDTCSCEEPVSSHVTLKNKANFFSVTLPVTPVSNCLGNASLMLPPYMSIEVEVWLNYSKGLTMVQMENIMFDSNPLKITFINGTPPSIQCTFTNDVMIINHHLAGCLVYYANMSQPAYAMRDNDESSVTVTITNISSGYYNISVIPLTFPFQYLNSVYINANTIKPTITMTSSTTQHNETSSSTCASISFSVSPSTSSSNETESCISSQVVIPVVISFFVACIVLALIIIIQCFCCIKYYCMSRNVGRVPPSTEMTDWANYNNEANEFHSETVTSDSTDSGRKKENPEPKLDATSADGYQQEAEATTDGNKESVFAIHPIKQRLMTAPYNTEQVHPSTPKSSSFSAKSEDALLHN